MITLPGNLTSPRAGPILCPGAPVRMPYSARDRVTGDVSTGALRGTMFAEHLIAIRDGNGYGEIFEIDDDVTLDRLVLDLESDLGPTVALRWLGRHCGIDVGIGCPEWTYHHDEHGGWYRLRGVGGEVVFFSTGHPASGTTKAGAKWVTLPALPTDPLEALVAACLYAAGVPRE